jgi:hypothetical protein
MRRDGDDFALSDLALLGGEMVRALNTIARSNPEASLFLSRNVFSWPSVVGRKRGLNKYNQ